MQTVICADSYMAVLYRATRQHAACWSSLALFIRFNFFHFVVRVLDREGLVVLVLPFDNQLLSERSVCDWSVVQFLFLMAN